MPYVFESTGRMVRGQVRYSRTFDERFLDSGVLRASAGGGNDRVDDSLRAEDASVDRIGIWVGDGFGG